MKKSKGRSKKSPAKKRMGFLSYLGILFIVVLVAIAGAGFYFYNYHVFKTIRICEGESVDMRISCTSQQDCLDEFQINLEDLDLDELPEFIRSTARDLFDRNLYCEGTCRVGSMRGLDFVTKEFETIEVCEPGERETVVELGGKELLGILKYLNENR
jgi:hypothetical protein